MKRVYSILMILTATAVAALAQSSYYRPLTLAPDDHTGGGGGAAAPAPAEAHHGKSADEIAKELANPNNDIAKLTFKNQFRSYKGDLPDADDQWNYTLLFQPVFPFSLGQTTSGAKEVLFFRPAFPFVVEQPVLRGVTGSGGGDWDGVTALGDIGFDVAYGQTLKSGWLWAAGMAGTLPTATDSDVAGKQLRLGPEMIVAKIFKKGVLGVFPSHQWDVTGWGDSYYSTTTIQPIVALTPGGGWQIATKGLYNYDWRTEEWTVPLNLTISKTVMICGKPWQFEIEVNYYVDQPDAFGPEWMIGLNVSPIVNNFIANLIKGKK